MVYVKGDTLSPTHRAIESFYAICSSLILYRYRRHLPTFRLYLTDSHNGEA